jgi:hypothetical protein
MAHGPAILDLMGRLHPKRGNTPLDGDAPRFATGWRVEPFESSLSGTKAATCTLLSIFFFAFCWNVGETDVG